MNKNRMFTIMVINIVLLTTILGGSQVQILKAAIKQDSIEYLSPDYSEVSIAKKIIHRDGISRVATYDTFIDDSFTIEFIINNFGAQMIYNVTLTNPESNLTSLGYSSSWFAFSGEINYYWDNISSTTSVIHTYSITPKRTGTYIFGPTNLTYTNGTHYFSKLSEQISFTVYEFDETAKVVKSFLIGGEKEIPNGRSKRNNEFFIQINITNYFRQKINVTLQDSLLNTTVFSYNETLLQQQHNFSTIALGQSVIFYYNASASLTGFYDISFCTINILFEFGGGDITYSNELQLEVYDPIYEGPNWTKKVPLLSVAKYFQIADENGNLINRTKLAFDTSTLTIVSVIINITNTGIVEARNIRVIEETYQSWVFDTNGANIWSAFNLTEGQFKILNYTIYPLILGVFKIEPTVVTYDFQNQETLLMERNYKLYSNTLEIVVEIFVPEKDFTKEWWITIGICIGLVLLAIIPIVITFLLYSRRRLTQRGI